MANVLFIGGMMTLPRLERWVRIVGIIAIVALVLAAVLTARVSQPLQHLAEAVKEYVPPASTDRIAVTSRAPQEVRILARHFNLSARRMNELYGRLVAMLAERESGEGNGKSPGK